MAHAISKKKAKFRTRLLQEKVGEKFTVSPFSTQCVRGASFLKTFKRSTEITSQSQSRCYIQWPTSKCGQYFCSTILWSLHLERRHAKNLMTMHFKQDFTLPQEVFLQQPSTRALSCVLNSVNNIHLFFDDNCKLCLFIEAYF